MCWMQNTKEVTGVDAIVTHILETCFELLSYFYINLLLLCESISYYSSIIGKLSPYNSMMDPEFRSYKNIDRYGMILCTRGDVTEGDKAMQRSQTKDPLASEILEAMALKSDGKYCKALLLFGSILKMRIVTLGHDHPNTCNIRNTMAYIHLKRKCYGEAFKLHNQIKSAFTDRCNLIYELYHDGEYEKAIDFAKRIYDHLKQVSNSRDREGLKIRTLIANMYAAINKYKEALKIYEEIYEAYYHTSGPDHEDTLTVQRRIGLVFQDLGKLDEAFDTFKDILDKRLVKLGHDHEDTMVSHKDLADLLVDRGKYSKSLDIYKDVYATESEIRPDHPDTLDTRCQIAKLLSVKGKFKEAHGILNEVYEAQIKHRRHTDVISTMILTGRVLQEEGKPRAAMNMYLKVYKAQKNPSHPFTLEIEKNVAVTLLNLEEYDNAGELFTSLYRKFSSILSPEHTKSLEVQYNLARILLWKGDSDEALRLFNIANEIQKREDFLGPDHPLTLKTKLGIAEVYAEQEKYVEALEIYYEVLDKRLLVLSSDNAEILQIQCDIAAVYRSQAKYDKSFQMYYNVYEKRVHILGELHPDTLAAERQMDILSLEMPSPKLLVAAHRNEIKLVKYCVEKGDDINVRDIDGSVALHLASKLGHPEIIEYLLDNGATYNAVNREGKRPVDVATIDSVKHLFNAVDMIFKVVKNGNYQLVVHFTEEEKAHINAKDGSGFTPLHWAVSLGYKRIVAFLLENGCDFMAVTKNGCTALHVASGRSFKDVVETLLIFVKEKKPEKLEQLVNAKTSLLGTTSLHNAAENNNYATVKLLLQYGADTRIRNKLGKYPMDLTARHDIRTMLIARDVNTH